MPRKARMPSGLSQVLDEIHDLFPNCGFELVRRKPDWQNARWLYYFDSSFGPICNPTTEHNAEIIGREFIQRLKLYKECLEYEQRCKGTHTLFEGYSISLPRLWELCEQNKDTVHE